MLLLILYMNVLNLAVYSRLPCIWIIYNSEYARLFQLCYPPLGRHSRLFMLTLPDSFSSFISSSPVTRSAFWPNLTVHFCDLHMLHVIPSGLSLDIWVTESNLQTQICRHITLFFSNQLNFYLDPSFYWHWGKLIEVKQEWLHNLQGLVQNENASLWVKN